MFCAVSIALIFWRKGALLPFQTQAFKSDTSKYVKSWQRVSGVGLREAERKEKKASTGS
jgi:hypothetical protein